MSLYINVIKEASGSNGSSVPAHTNEPGIGMWVSQAAAGTTFDEWEGAIDDVRIYNRALSATEVKKLYELGATTKINKTVQTIDLKDGLVGWWTFDGPDMKQNVVDKSGQGNTGYLTNIASTTTVPGKIGQALQFDGINDDVDAGQFNIHTYSELTFAAWVKFEGRGSSGAPRILSESSSENGPNLSWSQSDDRIQWGLGGSGETINSADNSVTRGVWTHVAGTYVENGSSDDIRLYIDGNLVQTGLENSSNNSETEPLKIGSKDTGAYWIGELDDVRVYNRALSPTEVKKLYELGGTTKINKPVQTTNLSDGLVSHWTFDGPRFLNNVTDLSGQENTGYLAAGFTSTTTVPGKIGQALKFDGVDDYVDFGDLTILDGINTISFSSWVYLNSYPSDSTRNMIISKDNVYEWYFQSGEIRLRINNDADLSGHAITLDTGRWYHLAATMDSNGRYIYIDGTLKENVGASASISNNSFSLTVGSRSAAHFFDGIIDDVRIYNRALSATEINHLYLLGR